MIQSPIAYETRKSYLPETYSFGYLTETFQKEK